MIARPKYSRVKDEYDVFLILAKNIKRFRFELRMSQKKLARKSGLSLYKIQLIERGETDPHLDELFNISQALKTTLSELVKIFPV
jgi:transcriptional regulator with XRE-family HTH domain